jgi:hypothetical protein
MDVGSVSSSVSAVLVARTQSQLGVRQPEAEQKTQPVQQPQKEQEGLGVRSADESEASSRVQNEVERSQVSRPTVNANGQTVGTRINITA